MHAALRGISAALLAGLLLVPGTRAEAAASLVGSGSSFAGIEFQQWSRDVSGGSYNLNVNYSSSSSGAGRQQFRDNVVDFAVTDIRYNKFDGSPPPDGTYIYIPITAGGIAVMYNLKKHGFGEGGKPVQLSDYSLCGIFTGGIAYWDDAPIAEDNPGVQLPHVPVTGVIRNDPAGTNFVLEEYCIAKQPDLYYAFVDNATRLTGHDYPREPTSTWPLVRPLVGATGSEGAADTVAGVNNDGYVTAVEPAYAAQRHFPVAAVRNGSGSYVLPTEPNVGAALSAATQLEDGTHHLNFDAPAPNAYNPSTYSYMLARTQGFDPAKGESLTRFAAYCLTIGQSEAGRLKYASIGRNLILFGLNQLKQIPGYVEPTQAELDAIPADDAFNTPVVNSDELGIPASDSSGPPSTSGGSTSSTTPGGSTSSSAPGPATNTGTGGGSGGAALAALNGPGGNATGSAASASRATGGTSAGSTGTGGSARLGTASAGGATPVASLNPAVASTATTGGFREIVAMVGAALLVLGEISRRCLRRPVSV